jgi:hypothetical protein
MITLAPSIRRVVLPLAIVLTGCQLFRSDRGGLPIGRWYKGNTHAHTLWSDGDEFPEMVADWYKRNGYHFLAITDHNTVAGEERWFRVPPRGPAFEAYQKYRNSVMGPVEERRAGDTLLVRLRRFAETCQLLCSAEFTLIPGQEITQYLGGKGAHMNALDLSLPIPAQSGATLVEMLRKDLEVLGGQAARARRPIVGVLNHPNFLWSQTAEDLLQLPDLRFVEVYNGHPLVNILGDSLHASTERIWDIVLTRRLAAGDTNLLYGLATDDAHDYHNTAPGQRNPGRGWIMVYTTAQPTADALTTAMMWGAFYASTGVALRALQAGGGRVSLAIRAEPGVTYRTQFIGTRRGYDTSSVGVRDSSGRPLTRRYSTDVGAILADVEGTEPTYTMHMDELYIRARVISTKAKANAAYPGEVEMAWTQPVRP